VFVKPTNTWLTIRVYRIYYGCKKFHDTGPRYVLISFAWKNYLATWRLGCPAWFLAQGNIVFARCSAKPILDFNFKTFLALLYFKFPTLSIFLPKINAKKLSWQLLWILILQLLHRVCSSIFVFHSTLNKRQTNILLLVKWSSLQKWSKFMAKKF
jgi:hypothetical protein